MFAEVASVPVGDLITFALNSNLSGGFLNGNGGPVNYRSNGAPVKFSGAVSLSEDADVRAVMAAFEAAADFESNDEDISSLLPY
ncbi:hypothetical protein DL768_000784 [Monosporascus sp. mg162]|nr:hypothetical protein DL768_000784 [Monosporascus sp. mg162]